MPLSRRGFLGALLKGAGVAAVAPELLLPKDEEFRRYWPGWSASLPILTWHKWEAEVGVSDDILPELQIPPAIVERFIRLGVGVTSEDLIRLLFRA